MRKRHSLSACLYTCDVTIVTAHDICIEFIPCFDRAANRFIPCFDSPNDKQNKRERDGKYKGKFRMFQQTSVCIFILLKKLINIQSTVFT